MGVAGRRVAIVGVGSTPDPGGHYPTKTWRELLGDAVYEALADTRGLEPREIQAAVVAYHGEGVNEAGGAGPTISDCLGISPAPVFTHSANCAGGGVALNTGWHLIASGRYDRVLVAGFEKEGDLINYLEVINVSSDSEYDYMLGFTHADGFQLMDAMYMKKYGYGTEPIARWALQSHWYARRNPKAHYFGKPMIAEAQAMDPGFDGFLLRAMAMGEGAAAALLVPADDAAAYTDKPVYLDGICYKCVSHYGAHRFSYPGLVFPGAEQFDLAECALIIPGREEAYQMAGIVPVDIDLVQVYDCFGFGILQLEGLGVCKFGEGGRFVLEGGTSLEGRCPTNTDGGNMARGHASGADGINMVVESVIQLRGEAGERQVPGAKVAVCHDAGGIMAHSTVAVLKSE